MDITEPSYQNGGPNKDYVIQDLIKLFPDQKDAVTNVVDKYLEEKNDFGSNQLYVVYIRKDLINNINEFLKS